MKSKIVTVSVFGLIIVAAISTIGVSRVQPIAPAEYNELAALAQKAYTLQMDAIVNTNRTRFAELDTQLAGVYSNVPPTSVASLPAGRQPTGQEAARQQATLEAVLREKGITLQEYNAARTAAQAQAEQVRQMSALDRVRTNINRGWQTFDGDKTIVEAWGLTDFKIVAIEVKDLDAEVVADMHVWARFQHIGANEKGVAEPHNGLHYTFYFHKEGATWKIIDWEFEFLPGEGP